VERDEKTMMNAERERLLAILKERSYREGRVVLTSGKVSNFYIDGKQTTLDPEGAYLVGKIFYSHIARYDPPIEAVGGLTLGADPMVTAIAIISYLEKNPIPAFIVRKEAKGHGTMSWIEGGGRLRDGARVAIVEDVITTGGSIIKAIDRCIQAGFNVSLVLALVDREEGGRERLKEAGYDLIAIFRRSDLIR
jgi:orotate phosphoribosyltransferase